MKCALIGAGVGVAVFLAGFAALAFMALAGSVDGIYGLTGKRGDDRDV